MTISINQLRNIKHLVTHANCPDGVASALIIKDALPDVRVSFMHYGSKEHRELEPDQPGLIFCDFTPFRERVDSFVQCGAIVLDHHPTAKDIVEEFAENGVFGENEKLECGAWLAYQHVWLSLMSNPGREKGVRDFARLAAVRDTWKKDDPEWISACEQAVELLFWSFKDMALVGGLRGGRLYSTCSVDEQLFKKQLERARVSLQEAHSFRTARGTRVRLFQGVSATSDAAEILERKGAPGSSHPEVIRPTEIVAGFHYKMNGDKLQLQFSTRSHTGYDVGSFCKAHGGGGHRAAAGFTIDQSPEVGVSPYAVLRLLLDEWESANG